MSKATVATKVVVVVAEAAIERKAVELDANTQAMITEFVTTRDLITELEKTKKELDAQIKAVLGDADAGIVNGVVRIEASKRSRSGIDSTVLKTAFPEAYEASKTSTDYVVLVVK